MLCALRHVRRSTWYCRVWLRRVSSSGRGAARDVICSGTGGVSDLLVVVFFPSGIGRVLFGTDGV